MEQLYTLAETSERLGLSVTTIRRRIGDGTMPHHRVGKFIRFSADDLQAYVESTAVRSSARGE